jgi:hypothetical protein
MDQLFIIHHSETDKYGDEYFVNDFVSAPSKQNAWFLAGATLASGSVQCLSENCFDDGLEAFSVDVWTPKDCEFWDVFDEFRQDEWADDLMVWAVQNRRAAALLHDMATTQVPPCQGLLGHAQFISLVEQYKLEQSILHKRTSIASGKPNSL